MQSFQKNFKCAKWQKQYTRLKKKKPTAVSPYYKAIIILFWNHMGNADIEEGFRITIRANKKKN